VLLTFVVPIVLLFGFGVYRAAGKPDRQKAPPRSPAQPQPAYQSGSAGVADAAYEFHKARQAEREMAGRQAILDHVKEQMRRHNVKSLEAMAFNWDHDVKATRWILQVFRGTAHHDLSFAQADVEVWVSQPELIGKYDPAVLDLVEAMMKE
jgi:hypothetical protein